MSGGGAGIEIAVRRRGGGWSRALPGAVALCRRAARAALEAAPRAGAAELCILLADDATVRRLNRDWRGKDKPTNVLSFPAQDWTAGAAHPPAGVALPLGDVVLAFETVAAEAAQQGKDLADHAAHLVVHGVLHLLGHDHEEDAEAEAMEALERRVLAGLGIADPYAVRRTAAARGLRREAAHG